MPKTTQEFLIAFRIPPSQREKYLEWLRINNLTDKGQTTIGLFMLNNSLEKTPFLKPELQKQVEHLLIEGNDAQKIAYIVEKFFEFHEKYPYLNIQRTITPEDAGFPPNLPCVKALHWEGKFLGFQCIIKNQPIDLPRISLKDSQGHRITLKITQPDLCFSCVELCKKQKVGLHLFSNITLEQIKTYKEQRKIRKIVTDVETIPALQKRMMQTEKLRNAGLYHMSYEQAQLVFNIVTKRGDKWKGITKASKTSKLSRPTIYKLLRAFPEGLQ